MMEPALVVKEEYETLKEHNRRLRWAITKLLTVCADPAWKAECPCEECEAWRSAYAILEEAQS